MEDSQDLQARRLREKGISLKKFSDHSRKEYNQIKRKKKGIYNKNLPATYHCTSKSSFGETRLLKKTMYAVSVFHKSIISRLIVVDTIRLAHCKLVAFMS